VVFGRVDLRAVVLTKDTATIRRIVIIRLVSDVVRIL
jgi:hypothetical protein